MSDANPPDRLSVNPNSPHYNEAALELSYQTNAEAGPDEDAEAALRRRLAETAEKEMWNGTTLVGPHRDDIGFALGGRDMAGFASRGQQRSAILSFKLAELELVGSAGCVSMAVFGAVLSILTSRVFVLSVLPALSFAKKLSDVVPSAVMLIPLTELPATVVLEIVCAPAAE